MKYNVRGFPCLSSLLSGVLQWLSGSFFCELEGEGEETVVTASPCSLLFIAGLQFEFINPIFEFSKGMNELQLNDAEYALLIAINIFSAGKQSGRSEELQQ